MNLKSIPCGLNALLSKIGGLFQAILLLVIRAYWGWEFFQTGKGKLNDLSRPTAFFTHLHIPHPHLNAIVVGSTECFGGLLLLAGLGSRFIAPVFIFEMIIAYVTADRAAAHAIFSDPDQFTSAAPFLFLYASVIVFVFGPGRLSLDALIFRKKAS